MKTILMLLCAMTAAVIILVLMIRSLYLLLSKAEKTNKEQDKTIKERDEAIDRIIGEYSRLKVTVRASYVSDAQVEERQTSHYAYFAVYKTCAGEKIELKRIHFNPADPDDREYKRIFAEEVAEKLYEQP